MKNNYGSTRVAEQITFNVYHSSGDIVTVRLDNVVMTETGGYKWIDAKHQQNGMYHYIEDKPYTKTVQYTDGQKKAYSWITNGEAVKVECRTLNESLSLNVGDDILPDLEKGIEIMTNNAAGEIIPMGFFKP